MTDRYSPDYDHTEEEEEPSPPRVSPRSRAVALVLGALGGWLGLQRFYTGRITSGVFMALTVGGLGMWWFYDLVLLIAGDFRDAEGLPLREWGVGEIAPGRAGVDSKELAALTEQLEQVQHELGELAERMDFTERLLTQQREKERLGKGT